MAHNNSIYAWAIAALLLGAVFTYFVFPREVTVVDTSRIDAQTKTIADLNDQNAELSNQLAQALANDEATVPNVTTVTSAEGYLSEGKDAIFDELGDEDEFLTCGSNTFDEDEVSISKVNSWSYTWIDSDEYTVTIDGRFKFDTDDERPCHESRTYEVLFEDGEDPVVTLH